MGIESRDHKIQALTDELLVLGSMVEQMVFQAVEALQNRSVDESKRIYDYDRQINRKHLSIESTCLDLISKDPPILAKDLRLLASLLEVNTEIERIGDQAKGIARINLEICLDPPAVHAGILSSIVRAILASYHEAVGAFVSGDTLISQNVVRDNTAIRAQLTEQKIVVIDQMTTNPPAAQNYVKFFWIIHSLETMLDHIGNICQRTQYLITGRLQIIQDKEYQNEGTLSVHRKFLPLANGRSHR